MHPIAFAALLAAFSALMVYAMVQYSRTVLHSQNPAKWRSAYLLAWAAIMVVVIGFVNREPGAVERNLPILLAFPLGWFALHALILRFGVAIRDSPRRPRRPQTVPDIEEEEDDDEVDHVVPEPPRWLTRTVALLKMMLTATVVLTVIAVGEQIESLQRLDEALLPYRPRLTTGLIALTILGFAMFMGGIIRLILTTVQSRIIIAGVIVMLAGACALGIVAGEPGLKLLAILTVAYVVARIAISMLRRSLHTPTGR